MTDSDMNLKHVVKEIRSSFATCPPEMPQIQRMLQLCRSKLGVALEELDTNEYDTERMIAIDGGVCWVFEEVDRLCELICRRP